jgi:hypothetical protein
MGHRSHEQILQEEKEERVLYFLYLKDDNGEAMDLELFQHI